MIRQIHVSKTVRCLPQQPHPDTAQHVPVLRLGPEIESTKVAEKTNLQPTFLRDASPFGHIHGWNVMTLVALPIEHPVSPALEGSEEIGHFQHEMAALSDQRDMSLDYIFPSREMLDEAE